MLITFAWAVEIVGVVAGFVNAVITTYPDGNLPTSWWLWLMALPMGVIAVAELGRIPLTSVLFYRHKAVQAVAFIGIVFLAGLAFENWTFGFERIVELRLKPVSAADLALGKANADLRRLESERDNASTANAKRLEELNDALAKNKADIELEDKRHKAQQDWIDRIVLIPRWGARYPVHVNSLIKDHEPPQPPPGGGVPNVTEIKKVMRDGR